MTDLAADILSFRSSCQLTAEHVSDSSLRRVLLVATLGCRECFADLKSGAPAEHDECAESVCAGAVSDGPHDRDDLLDGRRIRRVRSPLFRGGRPRW